MKIEITAKDWNAIRLFIREEESVLKDSFGLPGKKGKTWEAEYKQADRRGFQVLDAARKAIMRARVVVATSDTKQLSAMHLQNDEMRKLLVRWNDAWKVAAIVDSGHTNTDVALINAQTELLLEATATEKTKCHDCGEVIRCAAHAEKRNEGP